MTVAGPEIRSVQLTPEAYAHGLALALPEEVVMARPEGFEPPTLWSEATCSGPLSYGRVHQVSTPGDMSVNDARRGA